MGHHPVSTQPIASSFGDLRAFERIETLEDATAPGARLQTLADEWLATRRLRCAPSTMDQYTWVVQGQFIPFLLSQGVTDPQQIRTRHVEAFAAALMDGFMGRASISASTTHVRLTQVKVFLNWLHREGEMAQRVSIPRLKVPKKVITVLDRQDMDRLVKAAKNERDALILTLLTQTGVRASELCQLQKSDVFRQGSRYWVRINGKGAKQRLVGIQPALFRRLTRYVQGRRDDLPWLFPSRLGRHITPQGLRDMLKGCAERAGIEQHLWTHLLRHSVTTAALRGKVPQQAIIQWMGWSDDKMLRQHYAHLSSEDAHDAFMEFLAEDERQGAWTGRYQERSA